MLRHRKPALSIDNQMTPALAAEVKSGRYSLEMGVPLPLSEFDKSKIIYRKYEAESDNITDTKHKTWNEYLVAHPRVAILGMEDRLLDDDVSGVSTDDGLVMHFVGEPIQTVCIDGRSMRVIPEEQAELEEEAIGIQFDRYTEWGFHLEDVLLTSGPENRQKLSETYERQKNQEQAEMFSSMEGFFTKLMEKLETSGQVVNSPEQLAQANGQILDPNTVLQDMLKSHSSAQIKAMLEMQEADNDVIPETTAEELAEEAAEAEQMAKMVESGELEELEEGNSKTKKGGRRTATKAK